LKTTKTYSVLDDKILEIETDNRGVDSW